MKILSKIKRRADGDELPKRGHLVEMELFDTDRNPLEFPQSALNIKNYARSVPFSAPNDVNWFDPGSKLIATQTFHLDRISLASAFCGAVFDINSPSPPPGESHVFQLQLQVEPVGGAGGDVNTLAQGRWVSSGSGAVTAWESGYALPWNVLYPGDFNVDVFCAVLHEDGTPGAPDIDVTVRHLAAALVWIPSSEADDLGGWGGTPL